jgi:hypothetical protein
VASFVTAFGRMFPLRTDCAIPGAHAPAARSTRWNSSITVALAAPSSSAPEAALPGVARGRISELSRKQQGAGLTAVTCLVTLECVNCLSAVGQVLTGKVTGRIMGARFGCFRLRAE